MIEIIKDKSYRDSSGAERFVVRDGEKIVCEATAVLTKECAEIISLKFETPMHKKLFADGLIRTVLNAADLRGIRCAVCFDETLFDTLKICGFEEACEDGKRCATLSVAEFFQKGCKSKM